MRNPFFFLSLCVDNTTQYDIKCSILVSQALDKAYSGRILVLSKGEKTWIVY